MKKSFTKHADPCCSIRLLATQYCRGLILTIGFAFAFCTAVLAQQKQVTGLVVDDKGGPLPGVSIRIKGTQAGTTTDPNGKFSINVPGNNPVLVFSFIGYITQETPVGDKTSVAITLKENEAAALKEVVVIGYGTTTKKDNTGSVGVVKMDEINRAPVTSLDQALEGRIAGVQVTSPDGQPGAAADITIRGTGSVTSSSAPLYVVDGFPQEGNAFNYLSPDDVASITVLKDASSTAIYGARGSNGVIVITTKRGVSGAPKIGYNGFAGIQNITHEMKLLSTYDFVRLQNDISQPYASAIYFTGGKTLDSYRNVPSVNWQDKVFQTANFQNHTVNISGKSDKTNYYISGNYTGQDGLIVASGFKRYQGRLSLDQQLKDYLKVGITANYAATKSYGNIANLQTQGISGTSSTQNNGQFNLMFGIWTYRPVNGSGNLDALENNFSDDEAVNTDQDRVNPYLAALNTLNNTMINNLNVNTYAELKLSKDLLLRSTIGVNTFNTYNEFFNNEFTRAGSPTTAQGVANGYSGGISNAYSTSILNENTLNYNKIFHSVHSLNVLVGFTDQTITNRASSLNAIKVPNEALGVSGIEEGTLNGITASTSANALASVLARVNYGYKDKYLLTISARADGSSKFYTGHKWGYFPTAGVAWRLSEESFMKNVPLLSDTKIRASYGATGNNRVSDFAYASPVRVSSGIYDYGNTIVSGAVPTALLNTTLGWETATQLDIGLETGILKNRFQFEIDYYNKKTSKLLLVANLPTSIGYSTVNQNIGDISNQGIEISLTSMNIHNKNFNWSTNFNISFNKNKVLALSQNAQTRLDLSATGGLSTEYSSFPAYIAQVGKPVAMFYGYVSDGLYRLKDFDKIVNGTTTTYRLKPGIPYYGGNPATVQPGDLKFKDLNGDGITNDQDYTTIGNPNPLHFGGISNNFTYKNFDLNIFAQWSYGNQILNANNIFLQGLTTGDARGLGLNMFAPYADYWTPTNDNAKYQRPLANAGNVRSIYSNLIEDGSYLRLKTVQIGYTFPKTMLSRIGVASAKVFVSGQNLAVWTKYDGPDPEVSTKSSPTTPGFDYSPYPRARVFVIGLNVSL